MRKLHVGHEEVHVLKLWSHSVPSAEVVLPPLLLHLYVTGLVRTLFLQLLDKFDITLLAEFLILMNEMVNFSGSLGKVSLLSLLA